MAGSDLGPLSGGRRGKSSLVRMAEPSISIILPNYNDAVGLRRSLPALLGQSHPPKEIIVIDDDSTDDSVDLIEELRQSNGRIRLLRNDTNRGVVYSQNRGWIEVSGDLIYLAAADDLVLPGFLEKCAAFMRAHPGAGLVICDTLLVTDASEVRTRMSLGLASTAGYLAPGELASALRRRGVHLLTTAILGRRTAVAPFFPLDEGMRWHAEYFANYAAGLRYGACVVPEALVVRYETRMGYGSRSLDWGRQRPVLERFLERLGKPDMADVAPLFREAAVFPDTRLRALLWLLGHARGRRYLSPVLLRRMMRGAVLRALAPLAPPALRRLYFRRR